ncbi:MAG: CBS domain-containing protein, partial [Rhodospirillaceae bacterium]|nr:CBS domain-containing protein [Rhodospirillaceae bacterium]
MMRKIVPDVISGQTLVTVKPNDTARGIAKLMHESRIAAVLVTESDALVGIITERDMTTRV